MLAPWSSRHAQFVALHHASSEMSSARVAPEPPAAEEPAPSTADVPYTSGCEQNVGDRRQQEDTFVQFDDLNKIVADLAPSVGRDVRRAFWAVYDGFGGQSSPIVGP